MKKQIKKLTSIMFAVSLILCIIGCKKEPEFNILDYVYTVSFESNGGEEIDSQTVVLGETVEKPVDPVHTAKPETEKFEGWYTDKELTEKYDFSAKVKNSFTLYAKWRHEHSLGIWEITDEPKETEVGQMESVCKVCGETVTKELQPAPQGFRFVEGVTITGTERWTPSSDVFVSGRILPIPNLYVSDHEVTRGEYKDVMGSDPSTASAYDKDGNKLTGDAVLNNPVNRVSWYDAIVYCNKLSMQENLTPCYSIDGSPDPDVWGEVPTSSNTTWDAATCNFEANGYRLPTEAEWEWLARGGANYAFAGSGTIDDVAWCTGNTNSLGTREVKTKAPNGYGLYDMGGNVYEWCWDWVGSISDSTAADGAASGDYRVQRGGCWYSSVYGCQVALRKSDVSGPHYRFDLYGFRVVRQAN